MLKSGMIKEAMVKISQPSWRERWLGTSRAMARGERGLSRYISSPEHQKKYLKDVGIKGLIGTALGGAGGLALGGKALGRLLPPGKARLTGAALGSILGFTAGSTAGAYTGERKYLKRKGITPKWHGFDWEFSPEAEEKYIRSWRK